ncbi:MAG: TetR/AcrR family transcriptional regulator [Bacillota bacterium]|nr:TetR/AcrR family transcriptional regulator [Bacillota bacterium]
MPTQRFLSLPAEKQARITQALIDEFAEQGSDSASVAGIIKRAGIPRGSFYQYFADLSDGLAYVHQIIMQAKQVYLADAFRIMGKAPFFEFLNVAFAQSLDFIAENPQYSKIGDHMWHSKDKDAKRLVEQARRQGEQFYAKLIQQDIDKGLLNSQTDPMLVARIIMSMFTDLLTHILWEEHVSRQEAQRTISGILEIIRRGVVV